jgi:hypothetical protein
MVRFNTLKIFIIANEAKPGGNIGAMLSPYLFSTNMNDFCKRFNEQSKDYLDVYLSVILYCDIIDKTYTFIIKPLSITMFISYLFNLNNKLILLNIYDMIKFFNYFYKIDLYFSALIIFSVIKSFRRRTFLFYSAEFLKKKITSIL